MKWLQLLFFPASLIYAVQGPATVQNRPVPAFLAFEYRFDPINAVTIRDTAITCHGRIINKQFRNGVSGATVAIAIDSPVDSLEGVPLPLYLKKLAALENQALRNGNLTTVSDSSGAFAFRGLPPCSAHLDISAAGYRTVHLPVRIVSATGALVSATLSEDTVPGGYRVSVTAYGRSGALSSPSLRRAGEQNTSVPGGFEIKDIEVMQKGRVETFQNLLGNSPGVAVSSTSSQEVSKVSIRGSGIQSDDNEPIGVQFLLDGFPANQGDGPVNLEDFDLGSLQYAEIFRGADAFKYGPFALGGAINLVSQTGRSAPPLSLRLDGGSFGDLDAALALARSTGNFDYYLFGSGRHFDGEREHSRTQIERFFGNAGWQFGNAENRMYVLGSLIDRQDAEALTKEAMQANPKQANPAAVEQNMGKRMWALRLGDKLTWRDGGNWSNLGGLLTYRDGYERAFYSEEDPEGIVITKQSDVTVMGNVHKIGEPGGHRAILDAGGSGLFEYELQNNYQNIAGTKGDSTATFEDYVVNVPLYAQIQYYLLPSLSAIGGLQGIYSGRSFNTIFAAADPGQQGSVWQNYYSVSPEIGFIKEVGDSGQIYLNETRSWQPPTFEDLLEFYPSSSSTVQTAIGYHYRDAQSAWTTEIGGRGKTARTSWDVSLYRSLFKNELLSVWRDGYTYTTYNVPQSIHQGVEAQLDIGLFDASKRHQGPRLGELKIKLHQSYTYNDFHFDSDPVYGTNRIAGIPSHIYQARIEVSAFKGWFASADLDWCPARYPVDQAGSLFADPYVLLGASIGCTCSRSVSVCIEAHNLGDTHYASSVEPIADARGADPDDLQIFYPGEGLRISGGIQWSVR